MHDSTSRSAPAACLGLQDLERIALGETWTGAVGHLAQCPRCRAALVEVEANSRFLQEFASEIAAGNLELSTASAAALDSLPILEGYRLLAELQRGGQGIVYRAVHEASGRPAAVKVVRAGSWRRRARIEREAQLAAALRHPNIVTLHHCGELADGRYAIAMELVNGLTLDAWSRRVDESSAAPKDRLRRKLRAFAKICDGVQHAHQHGVIHRDLKPGNILVDDDDSPRILDFGIARRTDITAEAVTMTGELACTLAYASPEQVAGDAARVDSRTDVYSLGVVLYELLTGRLATPGDATVAQLVRAIAEVNPPSPRTFASLPGGVSVDADLETIVSTALAKSPDRRYLTAAALKADIDHYLAGEAIDARRDSRSYVLRKAMWRNRRLLAGVSLVAVTIAVAASLTVISRLRSGAERDRAANEARRQAAVSNVLREIMPRGDAGFDENSSDPAHRNMSRLSAKIGSGLYADDPETAAAVRLSLGDVCVETGALRYAEVEFRSAVRLLASRPVSRDSQLAAALDRLADLLARRRSFEEAQKRCESALELRRELFGDGHPDVAASIGTLARIRLARGDLDGALKLTEQGQTICRRSGEAAEEVRASLLETTALAQMQRGDADAASRAARDALMLTFRHTSDLEPETTRRIAVLAECTHQGAYAAELHALSDQLSRASPRDIDAEHLAVLLDLKQSLLGPSDPDLVETYLLLGSARIERRQWEQALAIAQEGEAVAKKAYGEGSMPQSDFLLQQAVSLMELMRPVDAVALLERRLNMLRPLLGGKDDLHLAVVTRELGAAMAQIGRRDDCDRLHAEAAAIVRERLGSPHRELAWCLALWGRRLIDLGDPEAGEAKAEEGLRMLREIDPSPQWHLGFIHCTLARAKMAQGRFDEAQLEVDAAVATQSAIGDVNDLAAEIATCKAALALRLESWPRGDSSTSASTSTSTSR